MNTVTISIEEFDRLRKIEGLINNSTNYVFHYQGGYHCYREKYYSLSKDDTVENLADANRNFQKIIEELRGELYSSKASYERIYDNKLKNMSIWEFIKMKFNKG